MFISMLYRMNTCAIVGVLLTRDELRCMLTILSDRERDCKHRDLSVAHIASMIRRILQLAIRLINSHCEYETV